MLQNSLLTRNWRKRLTDIGIFYDISDNRDWLEKDKKVGGTISTEAYYSFFCDWLNSTFFGDKVKEDKVQWLGEREAFFKVAIGGDWAPFDTISKDMVCQLCYNPYQLVSIR